jgi:GT2 family glycosyltransferase
MNEIRISIIIVSYKVKDLLLACLDSIERISGIDGVEIIVVDNNSDDGSMEAVKVRFPAVKCIENKFNAGFSGGNNQGMRVARGKFIFLLNPDTELESNALGFLESYLINNPSCALVAPKLINKDGSLQVSAWKDYKISGLVLETFFLDKIFSPLNYPVEFFSREFSPEALSGAALFFRKSLIDSIGLLDEQLFWMEDMDFCHRASKTGSLVYLPSALVIHHNGQSQKKNYRVAISNQLLSKLKYFGKTQSLVIRAFANTICFLFICSRILAFSLASFFGNVYRQKAGAYIYSFQKLIRYLFLNDKTVV